LEGRLTHVADTLSKSRAENKLLRSKVSDLEQITAVLGQETIHTALQTAKQQEAAHQNENRKNRTSRADGR
jgi:tRNA A37 N6-isopentenylltransferase MiaA